MSENAEPSSAKTSLRIGVTRYAPSRRMPTHFHETSNVTLVLRGGLEERVGRTEVEAGPLSVVVKPAGTEHANRFGATGTSTFSVTLPEALLRQAGPGADGLREWRWLEGGPAVRMLLRMFRRTHEPGVPARPGSTSREKAAGPLVRRAHYRADSAGPAVADDVLELLGCLCDDDRLEALAPPPTWLDDVRDALAADLRGGVRTSELATRVDVHPVYLARRFRQHFGLSPSEYVRQRRAVEAARLLAGTDLPASEVAFRIGFADQSHFCRVFREQTGTTPSAFRKLLA